MSLFHIIAWIVLLAALAVGLYFGVQAFQLRQKLAAEGKVPLWHRSLKYTFSDPDLARLSIRAGAAGVVAFICMVYLSNHPF